MNASDKPADDPPPRRGLARRIAVAVLFAALVFVVLWLAAFSVATSLMIGSGTGVVVVGAGTASDTFEAVLDTIADWVLGLLAAIGGVIAALFSVFGF